MMYTLLILLIPIAMALDIWLGDPPNRVHPICFMGRWAHTVEKYIRQNYTVCTPSQERWQGFLAWFCVVLPCVGIANIMICAAQMCLGTYGAWLMAIAWLWLCLAPKSLMQHALRVAYPLEKDDLHTARHALSMLVGRTTTALDKHATARACIESLAENLTDSIVSTVFWAAVGALLGFFMEGVNTGLHIAVSLAVLHRVANTLDAMWGRKNTAYCYFGTVAARADDILNYIPARKALFCTVLAASLCKNTQASASFRMGLKYCHAHESPNSAWTEAAFAGALGLTLGGPAHYGDTIREHPYIGEGTPLATTEHIHTAIQLVRCACCVIVVGSMFGMGFMGILL